jgi:hypothetical protein
LVAVKTVNYWPALPLLAERRTTTGRCREWSVGRVARHLQEKPLQAACIGFTAIGKTTRPGDQAARCKQTAPAASRQQLANWQLGTETGLPLDRVLCPAA